jgi:hypothetical protein
MEIFGYSRSPRLCRGLAGTIVKYPGRAGGSGKPASATMPAGFALKVNG